MQHSSVHSFYSGVRVFSLSLFFPFKKVGDFLSKPPCFYRKVPNFLAKVRTFFFLAPDGRFLVASLEDRLPHFLPKTGHRSK